MITMHTKRLTPNYYPLASSRYSRKVDVLSTPGTPCMATAADLEELMATIKKNRPLQYKVVKNFENNEAKFVVFTAELSGGPKNFMLKQQQPTASSWMQYTLILEDVAARIAEEMKVPANHVRILPPCSSFALTPYPQLPSTIHTYIEGTHSRDLNIMQNTRKGTPTENRGLTLEVIQNMSKNRTLPIIVGFDTFIGNTDRHRNNIKYCASTDGYIGIDHGDIFRPIVKVAIDRVKKLVVNNTKLAPHVLQGLKEYRDMLRKLYKNYPMEKIERYLAEATKVSKLDQYGALFKESEVRVLKDYEQENINLTPELIKNVDTLLALGQSGPATPVKSPKPTPTMPTPEQLIYYVIQPGDTLWKISKMYKVSIEDIVKANKIQNKNMIHAGQRLIIPQFSSRTNHKVRFI